jgi:hypothetical protein
LSYVMRIRHRPWPDQNEPITQHRRRNATFALFARDPEPGFLSTAVFTRPGLLLLNTLNQLCARPPKGLHFSVIHETLSYGSCLRRFHYYCRSLPPLVRQVQINATTLCCITRAGSVFATKILSLSGIPYKPVSPGPFPIQSCADLGRYLNDSTKRSSHQV